ncbi:MAG: glycosyltransferase [Pseudomonadota bacterium]
MTTPKLSIVIITLNEERRLPRLLDDLLGQTWSDFEIIHVDSQSDDATVEISRWRATDFPRYRVIKMEGRGISRGRNTGATAAFGERILFLDADTRLPADFLHGAMKELDAGRADLGVVCMRGDDLAWRYRAGFALFNAGIRLSSRFFPTAIGACLFSTPRLHRAIGGFDESLSLCEDCDYALRAFRFERGSVGVLRQKFRFDPRRLEQDGFYTTGFTYIRANARRLMWGELHNQEIPYELGHYAR